MPEPPVRIGIVEDQRMLREGLRALIAGTPGFEVVCCFGSMEAALAGLTEPEPNVMLIDIGLPGMSGIEGVKRLRAVSPEIEILILTVHGEDDKVFEAVCAGACGYLLKSTPPARLIESIRELAAGGAPMSPEIARKVVTMFQRITPSVPAASGLSPRELEILKLLAEGHTYKTSATALGISVDTVRFHIRNIYRTLHVNSKSEAVLKALRSGLLGR